MTPGCSAGERYNSNHHRFDTDNKTEQKDALTQLKYPICYGQTIL